MNPIIRTVGERLGVEIAAAIVMARADGDSPAAIVTKLNAAFAELERQFGPVFNPEAFLEIKNAAAAAAEAELQAMIGRVGEPGNA